MALPDFPPLLDGTYRLDTLLTWEDRQLLAAGWELAPDAATAPAGLVCELEE